MESLYPFRFERILALDERLTRQMQRTLAMLVRLQEMRRDRPVRSTCATSLDAAANSVSAI
jgi:hypothetical protein